MDWNMIPELATQAAEILGFLTGILGISLPFMKPSTTKKAGKAIGVLGKNLLGQRLGAARRFARTLDDLISGIKDGLE